MRLVILLVPFAHQCSALRYCSSGRPLHPHYHRQQRGAVTQMALGGLIPDPDELKMPSLLALAAATLIASNSITAIPAGEVGVLSTFGKVAPTTLQAGLNVKNPFSEVRKFSIKTVLEEDQNFVPTKEGLTVELDTALLYHIDPSHAQNLFLTVGEKFEEVVIKPELRSIVRGLTSEAEAKALYTSGRGEIQKKLKEELSQALTPRGIVVEDVLLKAIQLPKQLTQAIELKAKAEQEAQRMEFILLKEQQEAQRKMIEAKGIADFQKVVSDGISPELLKWKGIEATKALAESPNSKIVMVGNGKDSLPIILGGDGDKR